MSISETLQRNRATVAVGLAITLLVGALAAWQAATSDVAAERLVARVHDAAGQVHDLPLDSPTSLRVVTSAGHNVVEVADGAARITEASCPHGDCTRQAPISRPGQQLICLPNELWVEVVAEGGTSGELDTSAVRSGESSAVDFVSR